MNEKPTWGIIIPSIFLLFLGWYLGGFFQINYIIGTVGITFGIYNMKKEMYSL